jgi:hypothetical protein
MTGPILYTAELELADTDIPGFRDWYGHRHASDLYEAGMRVCTCYRAVEGGLTIVDIYEADDWAVFETPAYRGIGERDPHNAEILAKRTNKAATVYANSPGIGPATGPFRADWVSLARFAATPANEAKLRTALASGAAAPLLGHGAGRLRLVARTKDHPRNDTFRPRLMLLVEWQARPPAAAALAPWLAATLGHSPDSLDVFVGQRLYPWPDHR